MLGIALSLSAALTPASSTSDLMSEFSQTCFASHSLTALNEALEGRGWKSIRQSQGKIAGVIAAVGPMLDAQGLSSDYVTYELNSSGRHFELAVSETKNPMTDGHKLIGCSIYDFAAATPIDHVKLESLSGTAGQQSTLGDVSVEKWSNVHGPGSGMRAVFVPPNSPVKSQLGFTGMMLGTHFLDGATN